MALYQNGTLISGANTLPQMTLAEYQALPVSERPTYWERTDLNYNNIPSSQVSYENGSVEDALDNRDTFTTIDYVIGASSGSNVDSQTTDLTQFKKLALGYTYGESSYVGYTEIPIDLFKRGVTLTVYNPLNTAFYIQAVWSDNTKVKMSYNVAASYRAVILGIK